MLKEEKLYEESMQVTRHLQVQQISPRCNGNFRLEIELLHYLITTFTNANT